MCTGHHRPWTLNLLPPPHLPSPPASPPPAVAQVNENLPNLLPAVPIVLGAGGLATDFQGAPLARRRLVDGRTSALYSANTCLHARLLQIITQAECGGAV